jgi:hypothetical protein
MNINTQLFITFTKIGGFTIGGGMAMVPLMEAEIVDKQKWLTKEEFLDIMAVSQATPGIFAIDMASHIGYKVSGLKGAILSALGNILPSLVIILAIAFCFSQFKDNVYVEAIFKGIRQVGPTDAPQPVDSHLEHGAHLAPRRLAGLHHRRCRHRWLLVWSPPEAPRDSRTARSLAPSATAAATATTRTPRGINQRL